MHLSLFPPSLITEEFIEVQLIFVGKGSLNGLFKNTNFDFSHYLPFQLTNWPPF